MEELIINPHQRCGYSDSPFARIHYFYTAGSRNGLEGVANGGHEVPKSRKRCSKCPKRGFAQKLKVPKWICRSPLAHFGSGPPFFAISGPARGQIYRKKIEKIIKIMVLAHLRLVTAPSVRP